ncbi:hypothetical protein [Phormidesmis sp. 146-33]
MFTQITRSSLRGLTGRSVLLMGAILLSYSQGIGPSLSAPTNPASQKPDPSLTTPSPEQQFIPQARIALTSDRVTVLLKNNTYATISYQVIGDTKPRTLAGRSTVLLQKLRTPVTLTLDRQDAGLLKVTPTPMSNAKESLEVTLDTTTDLSADATTMRVESTGAIFLY